MTDRVIHLRVLSRMRADKAMLLQGVDWKHSQARWSESEKAAARHLYTIEIAALDEAIHVLTVRGVREATERPRT